MQTISPRIHLRWTSKSTSSPWLKGFFCALLMILGGVAFAQQAGIPNKVPLDEVIEGEHFWQFLDGREYAGAKGKLTLVKDEPEAGQYAMKLAGDFTGGGAYVAALKKLDDLGLQDVTAFHLRIKTDTVTVIGIRLVDGSGQTHQKKNFQVVADGQWHDVTIKPTDIAGGEHWGGANDGVWHNAPRSISIALAKPSSENKVLSLLMTNIYADALLAGQGGEPAYRCDFEKDKNQPQGWTIDGAVTLDTEGAFRGKQSLMLQKTESTLRSKVLASGPSFPVRPGMWEIQFACKTEMDSMDNSYNGTLSLEFLNGAGVAVGRTILAEPFRKTSWKPNRKQVDVPSGAVSARFVAQINKETIGKFWLDELSAAAMAVERKDDRVKRLTFASAQLGNLFYPEDSKEFTIEMLASKPLPQENLRKVSCTVTDYWGAEQHDTPLVATLERKGKSNELFRYVGKVNLSSVPMEIGRYYELHGSIAREGGEPFANYTSFAILPEAPANSYKPEEVPFTSRNWDNRIRDYVKLTHRLGIRICGIWGKMEPDPKNVQAPQLDVASSLGMGYLTSTPAQKVELRVDGWETKYNEEALRQGVRNYFEKFGAYRPVIINLGNEPHGIGDGVKTDVEAYRIVYTEIKKIDPNIFVVGTSVGPSEEYFKAGLGQWCDAYDFHSYEDPEGVRTIVSKNYPDLFKKYGHPKPIWCTEIGLNSQGMTRQAVASVLYKKFANFFAAGGANVSWFGLLYPDMSGNDANSSGASLNVFDSRYAKYAPKLDAIAYYNAVNSIAIKKFVEDKVYNENTHVFLFRDRDNKSLQICYKDKGREDVFIPMPGAKEVQIIRIDGTRSTVNANGKGITLTLCEDPIVLLYEGDSKPLPNKLEASPVHLESVPDAVVRGESTALDVVLGDLSADNIELKAPPFWEVKKTTTKKAVHYSLKAPENSSVREADLTLTVKGTDGKPIGELYHRIAVTGMISLQIMPVPVTAEKPATIKLQLHNNSPEKQQVKWDLSLIGEQELQQGRFTPVGPTTAFFSETPSGTMEIQGRKSVELNVPLADADLLKVYRARATAQDASGHFSKQERPIAAFYGVPKAEKGLTIDGSLDEEDWKKAPVRMIDNANQFFAFKLKDTPLATWQGPQDLSAEIRYLWDDQYFYVGVKVTDDIFSKVLQQDAEIWMQDGLQFLIDPMRTSNQKCGKYDYALAVGKKGPQVWCALTADGRAPAGDVKDIKFTAKRGKEGTGDITYEIAIPWSRIAPFKPAVGADLGFTLILNEDDGYGRDSYMTWFGNAHNKNVDAVGDLILEDASQSGTK